MTQVQKNKRPHSNAEVLNRFAHALNEVIRKHRELNRQRDECVAAEPQSAKRAELSRVNDALAQNSDAQNQLEAQHERVSQESANLAAERAALRSSVAGNLAQERAAQRKARAADRKLAAEIHDCSRSAKRSDKSMNRLDRKKSEPFLLIGRCLADTKIAPMNQPEALDSVLRLRTELHAAAALLADSLAKSAAVNSAALWKFYALLLALIAAAVVCVVLTLR